MRAFLIVLDSVGIGAAPDAESYGDAGSNTLANLARAVGGLNLPVFTRLGLGNIPSLLPSGRPISGVPHTDNPSCSFGAMQEASQGKDTTTGHWEMMGIEMKEGFRLFPHDYPSFPEALTSKIVTQTGRMIIGNKAASGTVIIDELGPEHMQSGALIVYTSGDSVLQVAAHEKIVPLQELYSCCEKIRLLANDYKIGRIIARPFLGAPGSFKRTENRKDFSYPLPEETVMERLVSAGITVITVGKLDDIFDGRGITRSLHVENSGAAQQHLLDLASTAEESSFIFANLIDFDMLYGHRRDPRGYASALENTDRFLSHFVPLLREDDIMIITADHGNDPTFKGTDHTREFVPLLLFGLKQPSQPLGVRKGFFDIAQSLCTFFRIKPMPRGLSFLPTSP